MNAMPASSSARETRSTGASSDTPSCSSTSALPHCVVNDRLPCFAMRTPAPAASSAAAVEMLNVGTAPPPVPHVSTRSSVDATGKRIIAPRNARAAPVTSSAVSPLTRSPMRSAAICAAVASPRITVPNASAATSASSDSPNAMRLIATWSALGAADVGGAAAVTLLPRGDGLDEPRRERRVRGHERDHEGEQPYALHVVLDEHAILRPVREVDHPDELAAVHERERDERPGREVLVVQQWMRRRLCDVLDENRLARFCDASRHPVPDRDAGALDDVGREAAGRRKIDVARFGSDEHQRAPLCLHVVAHEREQAI